MRAWQAEIMAQDVDAMWEADAAAEWERLNAPDRYADMLKESAKDVKKAKSELEQAIDRLWDASSILSETPMQAKVEAFIDSIEDLKYELCRLEICWERGERE